jgi:guanine deaminase
MTDHSDARFMWLALDVCRQGVEAGQSPFGACIVSAAGDVLACTHNRVWLDTDPTAHAEVNAIRAACANVGQVHLLPGAGATIYSTTEPCPMCFTAIHWARIARIVYGATIADAASFGFHELTISNDAMKAQGGAAVRIDPRFMRDDALDLFRFWRDRGGKAY